MLFTSRPRFTPLCLLLFSDLLLITQPKRWVPGGGHPGWGREEGSSWTPVLPLNYLFPGQWAAAASSGLCPSLPGPGPAGSGPIRTPYVPPLPSQQPPGPPHPPAPASFFPVSCASFRKHPWDPHSASWSPPPMSLRCSPCVSLRRTSWSKREPSLCPHQIRHAALAGSLPDPGPPSLLPRYRL